MVRVEDRAVIECPAEQVWNFVSDPTNIPRWYQGDIEVQRTSAGPISAGSTLESVVQMRRRRLVLSARCAVWNPIREVAWEFTAGPTRGSMDRWQIEAVDPKVTRLTRTFDLKAGGVWKLIQPVIARGSRRAHQAEMARIKQLLESSGHPDR